MIRLLIDGQRVNLAEDMSLEFYNRNPFFTSEGEHTMDIDISLDDPQNAVVYRSMHHIDVTGRPEGRQAILYHEKGVIIRGTEVVLEIDSRSVKIQIVAGNSEFNHLAGSDKTLHDLNLGTIENLDDATALRSLCGSYPEWDYVCTPVCTKATLHNWAENVLRQGTVSYANSTICNEAEAAETEAAPKMKSGTKLCPQPYVAAVVRRVLAALGYTLHKDFIGTHKELSRLIIVHGHDTKDYAQMVENWKVGDFFTQVENLFGVYFIIDNTTKTCDILTNYGYYASAPTEVVKKKDIIGDIDKKYDEEPPADFLYNNVSYKFPETNLSSFYAIESDLMKRINVELCIDAPSKYDAWNANLYQIWHHIVGDDNFTNSRERPQKVADVFGLMKAYMLPQLHLTKNPPYPFILAVCSDKIQNDVCLKMINQYGPRINEDKNDSMELSIVPAETLWCYRTGNSKGYFIYPLPLAQNSDSDEPSSSQDQQQTLPDAMRNGLNEKSDKNDAMFVAFYIGVQPDNWGKGFFAPAAITSRIIDFTHTPYMTDTLFWQNQEVRRIEVDGDYELSINADNGMFEKYWSKQVTINTDVVYVIKFRSVQMRDSRHIFNICNRKFYCQQLRYEIVNGRLSDIIEGTFYPVD